MPMNSFVPQTDQFVVHLASASCCRSSADPHYCTPTWVMVKPFTMMRHPSAALTGYGVVLVRGFIDSEEATDRCT